MESFDREDSQRRCIVTRQCLAREELIRFVAAPDGTVTPDLANKLPGRGAWVTASAEVLAKAIGQKAFARALRRDVRVPEDLAANVDRQLESQALSALSMCRKAGLAVTGFRQVDAAVRSGQAVMVLHALEAAPDGIRKIAQAVHAAGLADGAAVAVEQIWSSQQLDLALGGHNVVHAAAMEGGAAQALYCRIARLRGFRA